MNALRDTASDQSSDRLHAAMRRRFRLLLHRAMVDGRSPCCDKLGPGTLAAIGVVALKHPEASPDDILAAFGAFAREHNRHVGTAPSALARRRASPAHYAQGRVG
jgi:hypothetical protein